MKRMIWIFLYLACIYITIEGARCPTCTKTESDERVCGTDGKTYGSRCYLHRKMCKTQSSELALAYNGKCVEETPNPEPSAEPEPSVEPEPPAEPEPSVEPEPPAEPEVRSEPTAISEPGAEPVTDQDCCTLGLTMEPVCGSDGITYPSPCFLSKFANLLEKQGLTIARMGYCNPVVCGKEPLGEPEVRGEPEPEIQPGVKPEPPVEPEVDLSKTQNPNPPHRLEPSSEPEYTVEQSSVYRPQDVTPEPSSEPENTPRRLEPPEPELPNEQPSYYITQPGFGFGGSDVDMGSSSQTEPEPTMTPTPSRRRITEPTNESESDNGSDLGFGGLDFGFGGSDVDLGPSPHTEPEPTRKPKPSRRRITEPPNESDFDNGSDFDFGGVDFGFGGSDPFVAKPKAEPTINPQPEPTINAGPSMNTVNYYGKLIGTLDPKGKKRASHNTQGMVYAIDNRTLWIKQFSYDGLAPDALFWAGSSRRPDDNGDLIPDETGSADPLGAYDTADLILRLPMGKTIGDYKWISVWCRLVGVNFADVYIPDGFVPPFEHNLGVLGFKPRIHNVHSTAVVIVNTKTIRFESLTYDGTAPDAYFWVGENTPDYNGRSVPYSDEKDDGTLPKFRRETVTVQLPDDVTVFDIDYIGLWCDLAILNFGHVVIPDRSMLNVPPFIDAKQIPTPMPVRNSESLSDVFQVSWSIDGSYIEFALAARLNDRQYMSFGFSGSRVRSVMFESDVAVAWMDGDTARVDDYYLGGYSQCVGSYGACKDEMVFIPATNDYTDVEGSIVDGITTISYRRKISTGDAIDMIVSLEEDMYIVWAIGPINNDGLVSKHSEKGGGKFNFGRDPISNSQPIATVQEATATPNTWSEIVIEGVTTFDAKIGPSGGVKGYTSITGTTGWGSSWYLNGKLAPKLILERGVEYTFRVFGGDDETMIAQYHPFYVTDDAAGGYPSGSLFSPPKVYAGPINGSFCEYTSKGQDKSDRSDTFDKYFRTLKEKCSRKAVPGILRWTPDSNTPDTVYYQCYTHRYFGWKIEVVGEVL